MTSLSSRSLNGMRQCTIIRFRCSQMTLRLNQFARVVLIFDERHIPATQAVPAKPGVEDDRAPVRQRRSQLCSADLGTACDIAQDPGSRPYGASCDCALVKAA